MPVINPIWLATARKHWPLVGAVLVFLVFTLVHMALFNPTVARYERAVRRASELGLTVDPNETPVVVPPRVFALLAENAIPAATAKERVDSGTLTAEMLETLTRLASRNGLEVTVTEPGPLTQQAGSLQIRARLRLTGRYTEFLAFLRALGEDPKLYAVDRFTMQPMDSDRQSIEVWVSQYVLKHTATKP